MGQLIGESLRLVGSWFVALLMLLPALVIIIADKITMVRLRRRGGRD